MKERIELHCHTKDGGNATMYAGEVIRWLSERKIPAVAITDESGIYSFPELENVIGYGNYITRPIFGAELLVNYEKHEEPLCISVLIQNEHGKETIYRLFSDNQSELSHPVFDLDKVMEDREGLLIGSGPENSLLYRSHNCSDDQLLSIISKYDYVEVLPYEKYADFNKKLVELCDAVDIPVVAVGDVHYLVPEDKTAWEIMNYVRDKNDARSEHNHHFFSTKELLEAFSYLGEEKAYEIVVTNTHRIAEQCEVLSIVPAEKQYPVLEDADARLREWCENSLQDKYDNGDLEAVRYRLDKELAALQNTGMSSVLLMIKQLFEKAGLRACDVSYRGLAPGSIVMYILGLSEIDPIRYNLEPELIFGSDFNREIDIDINLPDDRRDEVQGLIRSLDGVAYCAWGGTTNIISENMAEAMMDTYGQDKECYIDGVERDKIRYQITGNFRARGRHPGGQIIFSQGTDYRRLVPFCRLPGGIETTYYQTHSLDGKFLKLDLLTNNAVKQLACLSEKTGVDLSTVPFDAPEVLDLFKVGEDGTASACADLPEFNNLFIADLVNRLKPTTFDDLVKIISIAHGTGTWISNGEILVETYGVQLDRLITNRDDVFNALLEAGVKREDAYQISEAVRKGIVGRGRYNSWNTWKNMLLEKGIPEWFVWSCEQIRYLFPRAHAVSYLIVYMRLGWFKVHYPAAFSEVMEQHDDK